MRSLWRNDRFEVSMSRSEFMAWLLAAFCSGGIFMFALVAVSVAMRGVH